MIEQMAQTHPCHFQPAFDCLMKSVFVVATEMEYFFPSFSASHSSHRWPYPPCSCSDRLASHSIERRAAEQFVAIRSPRWPRTFRVPGLPLCFGDLTS